MNLEALIAPIPGPAPTGVDLRMCSDDSSYNDLKDARRNARDAERKAESAVTPAVGVLPEWRLVVKLAEEQLATRTKDFEIACWLVEGSLRVDGFAGLRKGLSLLSELVAAYGGQLHSCTDDEGMETYIRPFVHINGAEGGIIQPILRIPLTIPPPGPFAAYQYQQALDLARVTDKDKAKRIEATGVPTLEVFAQAVRQSPKEFVQALFLDLAGALAALESVAARMREKIDKELVPSTSRVAAALQSVLDILYETAPALAPPPPPVKAEPEDRTRTDSIPEEGPAPNDRNSNEDDMSGPTVDREAALRTLAKVSNYFRVNEPHSPIAFVLDDLIRRAHMTFPELLNELLPDANVRRAFLTSAGIKPEGVAAPTSSAPQKS